MRPCCVSADSGRARRGRLRSALGVAAIALTLDGVVAGDRVSEWSESAAAALLEERYRNGSYDERIVAIRCAGTLEADDACRALRFALADAMTRRGFEVVEPRAGFDVVTTWDHLDCGKEDAPQYLGWHVVEIRTAPTALRHERGEISLAAVESLRGTVLHEGVVDLEGLRALSGFPDVAGGSELVVSRAKPGEEPFASRMAEKIACALKELPDKPTIDAATVVGTGLSPAQHAWIRRVGELSAAHLDRVLRSGFVREAGATLELDVESVGGRAFRVVPRVVDLSAATGEREILVDGAAACSTRDCVVEFRDLPSLPVVASSPSTGSPPDPPGREARPHGTRAAVVDIGDALGISGDAVRRVLKAVRVKTPAAARLERALLAHDPRVVDVARLPDTWQAWEELAGLSAAEPGGSAVSAFAREVADALRR